jgi:hypothetical protein
MMNKSIAAVVGIYALLLSNSVLADPSYIRGGKNASNSAGSYTPLSVGSQSTPYQRTIVQKFSDVYSARDYGVKCDSTETQDGVSNAGTNTLTSASYTYSAADIGKRAQVISKNNDVVVANGLITGGSGNSVTLDTNALYTGTNLRFIIYRTNDAASLNALIADVSFNGGGTIILPHGVCTASSIELRRKVFLSGGGMLATKLLQTVGGNQDFIKSENYDVLTGTGLNFGPNGTFNGIVSDARVPSWYGLSNLTIDGNWTNQSGSYNALSMYGNATSLDQVEVMNCGNDCIRTEASSGYSYSSKDVYAQEEGWYGRVFVRNFGVNGWRDRGPHDSEKNNITIYNSEVRGTGWGYIAESSANYLGAGYIGVIHAYPGASNIKLTGQSKVGVVYNDLGKTEIAGSNTTIGLLHNLGCGYANTTPCVTFAANVSNVEITSLLFQWYWSDTSGGQIGVDIPSTVTNIKIGFNGSKQTNSAANTIVIKNRGNFNTITGNISGSTGTGAVCADLGGSNNYYQLISSSCKNHLRYDSGGSNNQISMLSNIGANTFLYSGSAFDVTDKVSVNDGTNNYDTLSQLRLRGIATKVSTITTNTALTAYDKTVLCDASDGAITVTLPSAASSCSGNLCSVFDVKKIDSTPNSCTVVVTGGVTKIDAATSSIINSQYASRTYQSDGTQYWIR